jgi:hypothetical protein
MPSSEAYGISWGLSVFFNGVLFNLLADHKRTEFLRLAIDNVPAVP